MAHPPNTAIIPRGTDRGFRADIDGADGTETMKLVVSRQTPASIGVVGLLIKSLTWSAITSTFNCTLTATETQALAKGVYIAIVWRTDTDNKDVPIIDGSFTIVDTPRAS